MSVLRNVSSTSLNPAPLRRASRSCNARLTFSPTAKVRRELKSPYPQRLEAGLFDPPLTDLRDYLTKKRSVHQITPPCCCERLITVVLSEYHCNLHVSKQSVFKWLSSMLVSRLAKRHHSRTRRTFYDVEYPEVTANMMGPSTTPSRTKGKQPIVNSDEFDTEPEGVYQYTRTRTGVIAPVDYSALARVIEESN